jgi:hypothetical protein
VLYLGRSRGPGTSPQEPYLSERQWGTVREDTSPLGDAWSDFTHDQERTVERRSDRPASSDAAISGCTRMRGL